MTYQPPKYHLDPPRRNQTPQKPAVSDEGRALAKAIVARLEIQTLGRHPDDGLPTNSAELEKAEDDLIVALSAFEGGSPFELAQALLNEHRVRWVRP